MNYFYILFLILNLWNPHVLYNYNTFQFRLVAFQVLNLACGFHMGDSSALKSWVMMRNPKILPKLFMCISALTAPQHQRTSVRVILKEIRTENWKKSKQNRLCDQTQIRSLNYLTELDNVEVSFQQLKVELLCRKSTKGKKIPFFPSFVCSYFISYIQKRIIK